MAGYYLFFCGISWSKKLVTCSILYLSKYTPKIEPCLLILTIISVWTVLTHIVLICFSRDRFSLPAAHHGEVAHLSNTAMWRNTWPWSFTVAVLIEPLFRGFSNLHLNLLRSFLILCADGDIGLQLRLSARGTHHNGTVIFQ